MSHSPSRTATHTPTRTATRIALATAAAVLAGIVPPAAGVAHSSAQQARPLRGLLLPAADVAPKRLDWETRNTVAGNGRDTFECPERTLTARGADKVVRRTYRPEDGDFTATQRIGRFASVAAAGEAVASIRREMRGCEDKVEERDDVKAKFRFLGAFADQRGRAWLIGKPVGDDDGLWEYTAVVCVGRHVSVLTYRHGGQDSNYQVPPVKTTAKAAIERLER